MPKTFTFALFVVLLVASICSVIWWFNGGAEDGAGWVAGIALVLAVIVAVMSRVLGGAWFTDNANGH